MALLRNSFYNLMGLGLPLIAAVFSIPYLVHSLGQSRFGILTLVWAVVSYFGLFDLGLGRALTQKLAHELASSDHSRVTPLTVTSLLLLCALGLLAGVCMVGLADWGVSLVKDVPNREEVLRTVYWMAIAMPFIVVTSGFRGILEATHSFGIINLIRLPMGLFTFLGPVVVVAYERPELDLIACVLSIGRIVGCLVHGWYAWSILPADSGPRRFQHDLVRPLCVSGGWMSVSNIVGPMMGYLDRFVVGALASAQAVALYATPQELISKLSILPSALMSTMFPQFATLATQADALSADMLDRATVLTMALCIPAFAFFAFFSQEILSLWISASFAQQAAGILAIMSCGMLLNSIGFIPLTWLQARDKSRVVAIIHTIELPLFCLFLWLGITHWGLLGAAWAWALRIVLDAVLLWMALAKVEPVLERVAKKQLTRSLAFSCAIYAGAIAHIFLAGKIIAFILISAFFARQLLQMTKRGWF